MVQPTTVVSTVFSSSIKPTRVPLYKSHRPEIYYTEKHLIRIITYSHSYMHAIRASLKSAQLFCFWYLKQQRKFGFKVYHKT